MKALRVIIVVVFLALLIGGGYLIAVKTGLIWGEEVDSDLYRVKGISVDETHGKIDWQKIKEEADLDFVFIRATYGTSFKDKQYVNNYLGATKAGLDISLFHDFVYGNSVESQARFYINNVQVKNMKLKPAIRFDSDTSLIEKDKKEEFYIQIEEMVEMLAAEYNKKPMLYMNEDTYNYLFKDTSRFNTNNIIVENLKFKPMMMNASRWSFWQYKADGTTPGVPSPVNKLVYARNEQDYENYKNNTK